MHTDKIQWNKHIHLLRGMDSRLELIPKGYSSDQKYKVINGEQHYLLRVFESKHIAKKRLEYEVLSEMDALDVKCSKPLQFGQIDEHGIGFMLLTYIDGNDASEELPRYSENIQYQIGLDAGRELLKMHELQPSDPIPDWYESKVSKHRRYVEEYKACGVKLRNDHKILAFIDDHLEWMKNRPNVFQHDDFHVNNLIVKDEQLAGIIDFNRYDWGDPVHEFLKVGMFSKEASIPFSIGQIVGYHGGEEPDDLFWKLYSLYIGMCVISSVVWILKVKPEETNSMLERLYGVLDDHNYFESMQPRWFAGF